MPLKEDKPRFLWQGLVPRRPETSSHEHSQLWDELVHPESQPEAAAQRVDARHGRQQGPRTQAAPPGAGAPLEREEIDRNRKASEI